MWKTKRHTKLILFIISIFLFSYLAPLNTVRAEDNKDNKDNENFNGIIQVDYGYEFEDGSFDTWKSAPAVIINDSTVMTIDLSLIDYSEVIQTRKAGYNTLGISTDSVLENAKFKIYDGNMQYKAVSETIPCTSDFGNYIILKTEEPMQSAPSFSPKKELNDKEIYATGYSKDIMDAQHFAKSENILKQKVKITAEDEKNITFSIDSPEEFSGGALINGYNEIYGLVISTSDGGKAVSLPEIERILDENNIIYDVAPEIIPIDYTQLHSATDAVKEVEKSDVEYTKESLEQLEQAYQKAKEVEIKEDVTQKEIDRATEDVEDALDGLEEVPKKSMVLPIIIIITVVLLLIAIGIVAFLCIRDKEFMYKFFGVKKKEQPRVISSQNTSTFIDNNTPIEGLDFGLEPRENINPIAQAPQQPQQPNAPAQPMQTPVQTPVQTPIQNPVQPQIQQPQQTVTATPKPVVQPIADNNFANSTNFQGGYIYEDRRDAPKNQVDQIIPSTSVLKGDIQSNNEIIGTPYIIRVSTGERRLINHNQFTIGRDNDVNYRIPENIYIGKCHCRFMKVDNSWYIIDNNSSNKTILNGEQLEPNVSVPLKDKSEIILANERFVFRFITEESKNEDNVTPDTSILTADMQEPDIPDDTGTNVLSANELPQGMRLPYLIIYGKKIKITSFPFTLGRSKKASYKYTNDKNVSREHIVITYADGNYYIKDNRTTNGTMLNTAMLDPGDEYLLHDGDIISIVNDKMEFHI